MYWLQRVVEFIRRSCGLAFGFALESVRELARLLKEILIDDWAFLFSSFCVFCCNVSILIESSDYSNFYWNICSLLILFFIGVFLLMPSFRLICGLLPPSGRVRSTEFSLMEKLDFIWALAATITVGAMAAELMPDSCWLLGLLSFLFSFSEEVCESASADRVRSFRLVTRLVFEFLDSVSGSACARRLLITD